MVDAEGRVTLLAALQQLRERIRTRHYSYRTECSYADGARRFFDYLAQQDGPRPRASLAGVQGFLTHLAVNRHVSAGKQNQAQSAVLFLCREVLGLELEGLAQVARPKRGARLPVVLSVPEVAALLQSMRGTPRLMAALIHGGGLRISEHISRTWRSFTGQTEEQASPAYGYQMLWIGSIRVWGVSWVGSGYSRAARYRPIHGQGSSVAITT